MSYGLFGLIVIQINTLFILERGLNELQIFNQRNRFFLSRNFLIELSFSDCFEPGLEFWSGAVSEFDQSATVE